MTRSRSCGLFTLSFGGRASMSVAKFDASYVLVDWRSSNRLDFFWDKIYCFAFVG